MKSLNKFIVKIDKPIEDTISHGSLTLFVETKFDEFSHRRVYGEVLAKPANLECDVNVGDTMYFHHLVVIDGGQPIDKKEGIYMVNFDKKYTINNQAIAYKSKETGQITPMLGWVLLDPIQEDNKISDVLDLVSSGPAPKRREGRVSFGCKEIEDMDLKEGDVVGFDPNIAYEIKIDGVNYVRIRTEDLLYVKI